MIINYNSFNDVKVIEYRVNHFATQQKRVRHVTLMKLSRKKQFSVMLLPKVVLASCGLFIDVTQNALIISFCCVAQ